MTRYKRYLSLSVTISLLLVMQLATPAMAKDVSTPTPEPKKPVVQELNQENIKARISDLEGVGDPGQEAKAG